MGFAQVGLVPIVEIPYAKFLDCGSDMFNEIALTHWLSNGQSRHGMVIRLQGFDRGVFGGNFHTHNSVVMPPGVDVLCYSNGADYVRGFRHAVAQAKLAGRVVMLVDCTALLNLRHLHEKDRGWQTIFPVRETPSSEITLSSIDFLTFDKVKRYGSKGRYATVAFGNGVVTALQSRRALVEGGVLGSEEEMDVIDCPYISGVPQGLRDILPQYEKVVFADICKEGPSSVLSHFVTALQSDSLLPTDWRLVAAPRTYNPLASLETFLNVDDVNYAWHKLLS
jgi:hypothetical protein